MLVLLDRDGAINEDRREGILRLEWFKLLPRAAEAVALLTQAGFQTAIVTNQSAVSRGMTQETLDAIHAAMRRAIENAGGRIDRIYVCTDAVDSGSPRRKPAPGMLLEALADFGAPPSETPMVGDMLRDLEAAEAAGCPRYLVKTGKGEKTLAEGIPEKLQPVEVCATLYDAARHIVTRYG